MPFRDPFISFQYLSLTNMYLQTRILQKALHHLPLLLHRQHAGHSTAMVLLYRYVHPPIPITLKYLQNNMDQLML